MARYKIFKKEFINYNLITQYPRYEINQFPKIKKIAIKFQNPKLFNNNSFQNFLESICSTELFTNQSNFCIKDKNPKVKTQIKKIRGYGADINTNLYSDFLEFLIIFIFPMQTELPNIVLRKNKNKTINVTFQIAQWSENALMVKKSVNQPNTVNILINVTSNSLEETRTFLNYLNFPCNICAN